MTPVRTYRDVVTTSESTDRNPQAGRAFIAAIGIDRYHAWSRLHNAVSDATGALDLFVRLGFEPVGAPLFDDLATGDALHRLVTDDLTTLGANDSLVLFFAGHGHTVTRSYHGGASVKDGYLIPVDGDRPDGRAGTWLRLASWLAVVARLPAKHILVVLDACHSGLALDPIIRWRGKDMRLMESFEQLRARRSRRIITSALDDQRAIDGGPVPGHSLFTGCLIEGLTGGLAANTGQAVVTGSEIGLYVQRRVSEYPGSTQTPDFGALELDDRGELVVQVAAAPPAQLPRPTVPPLELVPRPEPARPPDHAQHAAEPARAKRRVSTSDVAIIGAALAIVLYLVATSGGHPDRVPAALSRDVTVFKLTDGPGVAGAAPGSSDSDATQKVHVRLRSTPSGAEVLDGQGHVLGTTPLSVELPPRRGAFDLVVKHQGYFDKRITLDGAVDADRDETLVPITDKNIEIVE
jgi:uncharacterized caspase-like protein